MLVVLQNLPHELVHSDHDFMDELEDVIASALSYMYVSIVLMQPEMNTRLTFSFLSISGAGILPVRSLTSTEALPVMLQDPPEWSMTPTAPTDWALLQQAKALRTAALCSNGDGDVVATKEEKPVMCNANYPLAMTALGMPPSFYSKHKKKIMWIVVLLMLATVAISTSHHGIMAGNVPNVLTTRTNVKKRAAKPAAKIKPRRRGVVVKESRAPPPRTVTPSPAVQHAQPKKRTKQEKQVPKWVETLIVESHKLRWKGQRFLI